ncbi:MAG: hypothetical protein Q7T07_00405 [Burkholderiaceae bacterium]|nr:hypothetical protein [Burkholderiaceae bacterium]
MKNKLIPTVAVLLLGFALAGCASDPSPSSPSAQLQQQIDAARTPTDHESLAKYYETEAASATQRAIEHRKLSKTYNTAALIGRSSGAANMPAYHNEFAKRADSDAIDYLGLAAEHRNMGKAAKP